ncbi:MAG: PAS domain S-box protein [Cyanobacteriota bacterium]
MKCNDCNKEIIETKGFCLECGNNLNCSKKFKNKKSKCPGVTFEEQYLKLLENMPLAVAIYTVQNNGNDFIIKDFNKHAELIEEIQKESIIGKNVKDIFPSVVEFGLYNVFQRVWKTGIAERLESKAYKDNRISGWRENTVYKLSNGDIVAVYHNLTEKETALKTCQEYANKLQAIYDTALDAIILIDEQGLITYWNKAAENIFGFSSQEVLFKPIIDFIIPEINHKFYLTNLGKIHSDEDNEIFGRVLEIPALTKDNRTITVECASSSIIIDNKWYGLGIIRDITGRKQVEEQLRLTQFSVDSSPDEVYLINPDASFYYVNRSACISLGYSLYEMLQMGVGDICPDHNDESWSLIWNNSKDKGYFELEGYHIRKNGSKYPVEVITKYIKFEGKEFVFANIHDTTNRKKLENEIIKHKNNLEILIDERTFQLQKAYDELELLYLKLKDANKHKDRFLSTMSHELRTPLNAILGFTQSLEKQYFGPLNERQLEYVNLVYNSGQHLLALINDILDISKIDSGAIKLQIETISPYAFVEDIADLMKSQFEKKNINLDIYAQNSLSLIEADIQKCKQIMFNLLNNAVKFTENDGRVYIEIEACDTEYIKYSVTDTGIGIEEKDLNKVFMEFQQLKPTRDQALGGTGIGLALCKRLVELHGGKIGLESKINEGSTFWFILPVKQPQKLTD